MVALDRSPPYYSTLHRCEDRSANEIIRSNIPTDRDRYFIQPKGRFQLRQLSFEFFGLFVSLHSDRSFRVLVVLFGLFEIFSHRCHSFDCFVSLLRIAEQRLSDGRLDEKSMQVSIEEKNDNELRLRVEELRLGGFSIREKESFECDE